MKRLLLFIIILCFTLIVKAQRNSDIGIAGGTSFYLGDINQEKVFYRPGYSFGPILRHNFNKRTSLRFKAIYTSFSGSDDDFNTVLPDRYRFPNTFSINILNFGSQVEYNFFPYLTGDIAYVWTPYIFGGIGYSYILSSSSTSPLAKPAKNYFNIPFGAGLKVNLSKRMSGGMEGAFHKSFSDRIDGIIPLTGETKVFKTDWHYFIGLFITYKFFKFAADCPAYN